MRKVRMRIQIEFKNGLIQILRVPTSLLHQVKLPFEGIVSVRIVD